MDIREFLTARLGEDEQIARAAANLQADPENGWLTEPRSWTQGGYTIVPHIGMVFEAESAAFIGRFHPARVLAEVAAKRRVMARHRPSEHPNYRILDSARETYMCLGCGRTGDDDVPRTKDIARCPELRDLAAPYVGHPDYQQEWRAE